MKFYESMRISDAESLYRLKVQAEYQAALFSSIIASLTSLESSNDEANQAGAKTFTFYGPHWDASKPNDYIQWAVDVVDGVLAPVAGAGQIDPDHMIQREDIIFGDDNATIDRLLAYASDASGFNSVLARSADLIAANKFDPSNIFSLVSSTGNNLGETTQDLCAMLTANSIGANNATSFLTSVMNYCKLDGSITATDEGFTFTPSPGRVQTVCWAVVGQTIVDVATAAAAVVSMASRVVGLLIGAIAFVGNFLIKVTNDTVSDAAKFKMNTEADNCCFNSSWGQFSITGDRLKSLLQFALAEFMPTPGLLPEQQSNIVYLLSHYGGVKVTFMSVDIYIWLDDQSQVGSLSLDNSYLSSLFDPNVTYNVEVLPAYHFEVSDDGVASLMTAFKEAGNATLYTKNVSGIDKYQVTIDPQFAQLLIQQWFTTSDNVGTFITPATWEKFDGDSASYEGSSNGFRNALAITGFYLYCALIGSYSSEDLLRLSFNLNGGSARDKISESQVYISAYSDYNMDRPDTTISIGSDTNPIFAGLPIIVCGLCKAHDLVDASFTPAEGFFENSMLGANGRGIASSESDLAFYSEGERIQAETWCKAAVITIIVFSPGSVGPNISVPSFGANRWDCRELGLTIPLYSKGSPRFTIPQYTAKAIKGALIISAAVAATVCASFVIAKVATRRKVNKALNSRRAESEQAWAAYKADPSDENYASYVKANKRYNRSAAWLGGTCTGQTGYSISEPASSGSIEGVSSTGYKGSMLIPSNPQEQTFDFDFDTSSIEESLKHINNNVSSTKNEVINSHTSLYRLIGGAID